MKRQKQSKYKTQLPNHFIGFLCLFNKLMFLKLANKQIIVTCSLNAWCYYQGPSLNYRLKITYIVVFILISMNFPYEIGCV